METAISFSDLGRSPAEVAGGLIEWRRGDRDEAVLRTLEASARTLTDRAFTIWVWYGSTADAVPVWILPVSVDQALSFAPRGPARVLARTIAAAELAGGRLGELSLAEWNGMTAVLSPGLIDDLCEPALAQVHAVPGRVAVSRLPFVVELGPGVEPRDAPTHPPGRGGITALASAAHVHPLQVVIALAEHGQDVDCEQYDPALVDALRAWGCDGHAPEPPPPSIAIDDDPCSRRRHARRALLRLLGMKKIGALYHTEFDHFSKGAPPDLRGEALEVGEALIRAGLLGTKPSVGQLHIYLRREALADIHALIDRGVTRDARLSAVWTSPEPGSAASLGASPSGPASASPSR